MHEDEVYSIYEYTYTFSFDKNPEIKYQVSVEVGDYTECIEKDSDIYKKKSEEDLKMFLNNLLSHKFKQV